MKAFAEQGGKVIWCSAPALRAEEGILDSWKELFGVRALDFPYGGLTAKGKLVQFTGMKTVQDMEILTDFLPDYIYPVVADGAKVIAKAVSYTHLDVYKRQRLLRQPLPAKRQRPTCLRIYCLTLKERDFHGTPLLF